MESAWGIKAARLPFRVHVLGKGVEGLLAPPLRVAAATQREEHGLSQQREGKAREEVVVVVTVEDEVVRWAKIASNDMPRACRPGREGA